MVTVARLTTSTRTHAEKIVGEFRFAVRSLRRNAGFSATAIVTLALGVALAASTFSVMNAYVLRAMPFVGSERLHRALYTVRGQPEPRGLEHVDWAALRDVVDVADYSSLGRFILHTDRCPQEISALECAPGALDAIGVRAALGRVFTADDVHPGSERVIMISDRLWKKRFGASASVLGQSLRISAATSGDVPTTYRIIGVLPPGFRYVGNYIRNPADTAIPLTSPRAAYMVRVREGVPAAYAAQRLSDAVRDVASEIPDGWQGVRLESVHTHYVREVRPVLAGVTVAAVLVLLIVVMNVGVLVLLRALRRQQETAVRVALGAEPYRLARMLLVEAAVICGIALAAGLAVAATTLWVLGPHIEARLGLPVPGGSSALAMDHTVLLWTGGIALPIALVLSGLPMLAARSTRLAGSLRDGGRGATDRPTARRARTMLLAAEIAMSTALLIGGGLMLRSVVHLARTDLGYETQQVVRARLQLPVAIYADGASFTRFYQRLEEDLAAVPNLSFALSTFVSFWEPPTRLLEIEGDRTEYRASITAAGPDYFRTLGMPIVEGRAFTPVDRTGAEPVIVISESLARRIAPQRSAMGTRIHTTEWSDTGEPLRIWRTVVGIVHDIHQTHVDVDLNDAYIPFAQAPSRYSIVYARVEDSLQWLETLRTVVASVDPHVFVGPSPPLSVQADEILAGPRFVTMVMTVFAVFAASLALIGLYGVTAYSAQQRTREVAIRMVIGATTDTITRMFLRHSGRVLLAGVAMGVLGGVAVARLLESQLHGVERFDPWTVAITCVVLGAAGLCAAWIPARRVARTDPMIALRTA